MNKVIAVVVALFVVVVILGGGDDRERDTSKEASSPAEPGPAANHDGGSSASGQGETQRPGGSGRPQTPEPRPEPSAPRTWLVSRVVDGDTLELAGGAAVRLIGIDTPERGECGFQAAADLMTTLVLGERVTLVAPIENTDQYGRWLRYVDVDGKDAGLHQIRSGLAIARYDSRDGYGPHPREAAYVRSDRSVKNVGCPKPVPVAGNNGGRCAPGYAPCVPVYPPDVDCADVNGPVTVTGTDPHGLDADEDGTACE